jgi:hypothetical protein
MPTNEKILLNYLHETDYSNTPDNQVGTDADQDSIFGTGNLQRTVPAPAGDIAYVRKFGNPFTITDLDGLSDPGVANLTWTVKTVDGATTYGSRANGGAYVDGSTTGTATAIRLEASVSGATTVLPTTMNINDSVVGGLTVNLPAESVTSAEARVFYISRAGSSYYDVNCKYGGARHTPTLTTSPAIYSYFDIATAYSVLTTTNDDGVEILDSETYDEDLTTSNQALDIEQTTIYATSGVSPIITRGIGARTSREVTTQYNNTTAIYFNENGNDANAGTWQNPKLTIAGAIAARTTEDIVYGGSGATASGGVFSENVTIAAAYTIEADYGYIPKIYNTTGNAITVTATGGKIRGLWIELCTLNGFYILGAAACGSTEIYDCTFYNISQDGINSQSTGFDLDVTIQDCVIESIGRYGIFSSRSNLGGNTATNNIVRNIIKNINSWGINLFRFGTGGQNGNLTDNVIYNCIGRGLHIDGAYTGTISNNTIFDITSGDGYGFYFDNATATVNGMIIHTTKYAVSAGAALTLEYGNFYNYSVAKFNGAPTNNNEIDGDPKLCKTTETPYKLGLSADSPCYRADASSYDTGTRLRIIEIDASDIVINGIKIDGQSQYNNAIFILDSANHTGLNIKWCSIYDLQGIAIDLYDDGTDLDAIILNNLIYDNGNGLKLVYGGNTIDENIIYNNAQFGIHSDRTNTTLNHNVFYNNNIGLYLESNSTISLKNSIFHSNSLYGINSEVAIIPTYCCITDGITSNVDKSDSSNITNNPLFVNTTSGSEDFNIKTIEFGYDYNSACKDAAETTAFPDIGAYDITRAITNDYWKKHQFTYNPRVVEFQINSKGNVTFNSGTGTQWNWSKARRRGFMFKWQTGQYSNETDRLKVEFFNSLYQRADKERSNEDVKVRFNPLPSQQIDSGTSATISATAKTITDSAKSLIEDEYKGYHVGVKFDSDSANGTITAATKKLLVAPSPAWTADEWIGYYFPYGGYYYYISDNDADELTLSDPDSTLANASNIDWTIEKYFKITENTATVLTVEDDDSELVAGTYDWIIRFIECHILSPNMKYSQPRYYFQKETWKTGYSMYLEEI